MKLHLLFPSVPAQERVVQVLGTAKREIDQLGQLANLYRTQKRALLSHLLSGEWRVKSGKRARGDG